MSGIKALLLLMAALSVGGCTNGAFTPTAESKAQKLAQDARRGEARKELFVECMELAAKMPRQADDDVADVVQECSSQSYYMTNYMD